MKTTWTKESMQKLLATSDAAVERGLEVIWERQTRDEKQDHDTKHRNDVGFSGAHAIRGTRYAEWVIAGRANGKPYGSCLMNAWHKDKARQIVMHYWKQLIDAAETKGK